jgi:8-amino-7-oxononanoate synthase
MGYDTSAPKAGIEARLQDLLDRRRITSTRRTLTLPKPSQIDFSSNDFLSLSTSPHLKSLYLTELQSTNLPLGSGGSRLLDGNSSYAETLEDSISRFHGAEAGLLFNSGYDANAGFFACVPQKGDVVVYDELVHASVHDGMKLSRATLTLPFSHNSVSDLRAVLEKIVVEHESVRMGNNHVFMAVESIYSMDGDVSPLKKIVEVVEQVLGRERGYVVVDEAHSTGVLGQQGGGLVCELGLEKRVFARLHTFGKAVAANGGKNSSLMSHEDKMESGADEDIAIILGSATLRHYLINYARPLIYTTFLAYPMLSLIRASYALLQSGRSVPLQAHLHHLTQTLYVRLKQLQSVSPAAQTILKIPNACPQSPIFSMQLGRPRVLASFLQGKGMTVRAVVPPTVPVGTDRVRICLHAGNTVVEVEKLVQALRTWCDSQAVELDPEEALRAKL